MTTTPPTPKEIEFNTTSFGSHVYETMKSYLNEISENRLPMCLPMCKKEGHGQMRLVPPKGQTREQRFCGVSYQCTYHDCYNSVTYPSKELLDFLIDRMKKSEQEQLSLF